MALGINATGYVRGSKKVAREQAEARALAVANYALQQKPRRSDSWKLHLGAILIGIAVVGAAVCLGCL